MVLFAIRFLLAFTSLVSVFVAVIVAIINMGVFQISSSAPLITSSIVRQCSTVMLEGSRRIAILSSALFRPRALGQVLQVQSGALLSLIGSSTPGQCIVLQ